MKNVGNHVKKEIIIFLVEKYVICLYNFIYYVYSYSANLE